MSRRVIRYSLDPQSIDKAIMELQDYKEWLIEKTKELLNELAREGCSIASAKFQEAVYDGTNDVKVHWEDRGEHVAAIIAIGASVLFIEFGTGVRYPDNHPEAHENGMIRGEYGHGLGKMKRGWRYKGEPGTNGALIVNGKHEGMILTYGNPSNMCLYQTGRDLREKVEEIARRVYEI